MRSRYEVLSFFFDGVPDPSAPKPPEPKAALTPAQLAQLPKQPTFKREYFSHRPFAEKKCDSCHNKRKGLGKSGAAFRLQDLTALKIPLEKLCFTCHERPRKKHHHAPALLGLCTRCHRPHVSTNEYLLVAPRSNELCVACHDDDTFPSREAHIAYGDQDCAGCHDPHASDEPRFLRDGWQEKTKARAMRRETPEAKKE